MILTAEIGLTLIGLLTIVRGRWNVGQQKLDGRGAFFVGGLCFLTIPVVYFMTAVLQMGKFSNPADMVQSILRFHLEGGNLNGYLIEFVVLLVWATVILLISGFLSWFANKVGLGHAEVEPPPVALDQPVVTRIVRYPKIVHQSAEPEKQKEKERVWEKRNLPLSDSVDSEATLL